MQILISNWIKGERVNCFYMVNSLVYYIHLLRERMIKKMNCILALLVCAIFSLQAQVDTYDYNLASDTVAMFIRSLQYTHREAANGAYYKELKTGRYVSSGTPIPATKADTLRYITTVNPDGSLKLVAYNDIPTTDPCYGAMRKGAGVSFYANGSSITSTGVPIPKETPMYMVEPYFEHLACIALLTKGTEEDKAIVKNWMDWYIKKVTKYSGSTRK